MRDNDLVSGKDWFGSKRIFHADDGWFVGTCTGDLGPLPHRRLAVSGVTARGVGFRPVYQIFLTAYQAVLHITPATAQNLHYAQIR
ncbi:MAG: hypothetical protein ACE1ZA_22260 [Pseudomonadales bacterium]